MTKYINLIEQCLKEKNIDIDSIQTDQILLAKKFSKDAVLPTKAHASDLGYDLYSSEDVVFDATNTETKLPLKVKTGVGVKFPPGWGGFIKDRSSMASKGFSVLGGVIDDYIGELTVLIYPIDGKSVTINKGDKIAQLVPIPSTNWTILEASSLGETQRGEKGFGSSDK